MFKQNSLGSNKCHVSNIYRRRVFLFAYQQNLKQITFSYSATEYVRLLYFAAPRAAAKSRRIILNILPAYRYDDILELLYLLPRATSILLSFLHIARHKRLPASIHWIFHYSIFTASRSFSHRGVIPFCGTEFCPQTMAVHIQWLQNTTVFVLLHVHFLLIIISNKYFILIYN